MIVLGSFKPKSIEELNAAFEQKFAQEHAEKMHKDLAPSGCVVSEEQQKFYSDEIIPEPEGTEIKESVSEETQESEMQIPCQAENAYDYYQKEEAESDQECHAADCEESKESTAPNTASEQEQKDLFEAERISQEQTELFEADNIAKHEAEAMAAVSQMQESAKEEKENNTQNENTKQDDNILFFKKIEQQEQRPVQPMKIPETAAPEQGEKTAKKDHRTVKTVLNTVIAVLAIVCIFINGIVFAADMPRRFVLGYGITVCEQNVEDSNIKKDMLLITKKAQTAPESKVVCALEDNKRIVVDFKQNISKDAQVYSEVLKIIPSAGKFVRNVRTYWLECGCVEAAVLLVFLIARVALSDKKEKNK